MTTHSIPAPIRVDEITHQTRAEAAEIAAAHADVLRALGTDEADAVRQGTEAGLRHIEDRVHQLRVRKQRARTIATNAYRGQPDQLLADLAADLGVSLAIIDRATIDSHLGSPVDDDTWPLIRAQLAGLAFDSYVATEHATRARWIDHLLHVAGINHATSTVHGGEPT